MRSLIRWFMKLPLNPLFAFRIELCKAQQAPKYGLILATAMRRKKSHLRRR